MLSRSEALGLKKMVIFIAVHFHFDVYDPAFSNFSKDLLASGIAFMLWELIGRTTHFENISPKETVSSYLEKLSEEYRER